MQFFGHDWQFWLLVAIAAIIKVVSSPFRSILRSLGMFTTSLFFAVVFADPLVDWLHLDPARYSVGAGVIIALTADGLLRMILLYGRDPQGLLDQLRGRKGRK